MRETPRPGWLYKHYKGTVYEIICIAHNCDDINKRLVIYKNINDQKIWSREIDNFMDRIECSENNDWRFDLVERN